MAGRTGRTVHLEWGVRKFELDALMILTDAGAKA